MRLLRLRVVGIWRDWLRGRLGPRRAFQALRALGVRQVDAAEALNAGSRKRARALWEQQDAECAALGAAVAPEHTALLRTRAAALKARLQKLHGAAAVRVLTGDDALPVLARTGVAVGTTRAVVKVDHVVGLPAWLAHEGVVVIFTSCPVRTKGKDARRCSSALKLVELDAALTCVAVVEQVSADAYVAAAVVEWRTDASARRAGLPDAAAQRALDELFAVDAYDFGHRINPTKRSKLAPVECAGSNLRPGGTTPVGGLFSKELQGPGGVGFWWKDHWRAPMSADFIAALYKKLEACVDDNWLWLERSVPPAHCVLAPCVGAVGWGIPNDLGVRVLRKVALGCSGWHAITAARNYGMSLSEGKHTDVGDKRGAGVMIGAQDVRTDVGVALGDALSVGNDFALPGLGLLLRMPNGTRLWVDSARTMHVGLKPTCPAGVERMTWGRYNKTACMNKMMRPDADGTLQYISRM